MTTLTVTAAPSGSPAPFVDVLVEDLPAGTERFTVWRVAAGRRFKVRSLVNVDAVDGGTARDFEAPFGVESGYQVELFDVNGNTSGYSDMAYATLTGLGENEAWLHDPLDPAGSLKVLVVAGTAKTLRRDASMDVLQVPSRSVGIGFPSTRGGVAAPLVCATQTRADGESFDALFGGYDSDALSIVCVRSRKETWLPPTLFAFGVPELAPFGFDGETVVWSVPLQEVAPPTPAVVTPLLTYDHFTAYYATYDDFTAAYPDYITASRDYSLAGV